ncbi:MAG TPA: transglutaminase-like domain-containing protein [Gemmataceae bacterium]|nr:transglutaminase-like domain-containing protein [Gemmataceae bacterium]
MNTTTRPVFLLGIGVVLMSAVLAGADSSEDLVEEHWEIARIEGAKVGFLHTTVRRLEAEGGKRLRATAELDLTFKRHNTLLRLRRQHGTEETPDGKVVGVFMRQGQEGGRQLVLAGQLEDGRMHVRIDDGRIDRRLRWSDDVVGVHGLEHLFQKRKPKPNDHWTVERYDPTYNTVVTFRVAVKAREEVALSAGTARVKLLRVELTAQPLEAPGIKVQPPPEVWWLDEHFVLVRRQFELEGLGTVMLTRTTRQAATAPTVPGRLTDIGRKTLLPLNRSLARPYATRSVVYRVTLRGDSDPGSALARDAHQEIRNLHGNTFELHVHPPRKPEGQVGAAVAPAECLESCHFIDSADERVKELARRAAGDEKDAWTKARRIERWVKQNMRVDNAVPLEPASVAARQLRGDCRQHALLTAALCRAAGIPARTAVGLLYVEKGRRPLMGFHMWTEVWIDGQWLGLDATLGLGGVSAAHIKINDHSWHDTPSLTPLLPASRILGKMTIRVLSSE